MVVTAFVDRDKEINVLDEAWSRRPSFVVIYGRRRVGKTRLVLEWCRSRKTPCIYFHALPAKHEVNLAELAKVIESSTGLKSFSKARFNSLSSLLELFASMVREAVVIIDEITYWVRAEPRVSGELQFFVDHVLPQTRILLVIVGSLVGVMHRSILGGGAPLYGRARYRIKLGELDPWYIPVFYPWLSREDWVRVYSLLGGVPYYHSLVGYGWGLYDIIEKLFLTPGAPLKDEVVFLLRDEFRDVSTYYSVLKAVAQGYSTPSTIANLVGVHRQHVSKYLYVLEQLGFVEKEKILFSKKGRYKVKDKLIETWFKIVEPLISMGIEKVLDYVDRVRSSLEVHVSKVFEEIALKYVEWLSSVGEIRYDSIGRYIHKDVEIDIVAFNSVDKVAHLFEVKWSDIDEEDASRIYHDLEKKIKFLPLEGYTYRVYIIAKSYRGSIPRDFKVITLNDMPFYTQ